MKGLKKGVHNDDINKKIDAFVRDFTTAHPDHVWNLVSLSDEEISSWVESDVREIIRIVRGKNIRIIWQNYPIRGFKTFGIRPVIRRSGCFDGLSCICWRVSPRGHG